MKIKTNAATTDLKKMRNRSQDLGVVKVYFGNHFTGIGTLWVLDRADIAQNKLISYRDNRIFIE